MQDKRSASTISGILLPSGEVTRGKRSSRSLRRRNAVIACSFDLKGKRVLDVGCADGLHSLYMSNSAAEVWGIDHRKSEIAIAKATARSLGVSNVRFEAGDVRDPELFQGYGSFQLVIAWGFLHRVGDIFSLLYTLAPLAEALSLEWRTPVLPMMSKLSLAYHPPGGKRLDPMNVARVDDPEGAKMRKVEGDTAFWEPTPGAVAAIARRLGFKHATLLGYDEDLVSERRILARCWKQHAKKLRAGDAKLGTLPRARVHMLFEKRAGSIELQDLAGGEARLPKWDVALRKSLGLEGSAT